MLFRILLACPSLALRTKIRTILEASGAVVASTSTAEALWDRLGAETFDLVIASDTVLPAPIDASVAEIRKLVDQPEVIVLTDREDPERRAQLQAAGSLAVVSSSVRHATLDDALTTLIDRLRSNAIDQVRVEQHARVSRLTDFASQSPAMLALLRLARKVVATDTSLLLLGETGVGKEWLARAIHAEGPRADAPFIAINCSAVPETLLESELFGHEKGAFTGATRGRRGYFELAHRGVLFLDEIGDLPFHLQAKLLRALQERTIYRLGSEHPLSIDVRIMAATNQDLEEAIEAKRFRRDLYYRLGVMNLVVPPLRDRREDIPALLESYFDQFRTQLGRSEIVGLSAEAVHGLQRYPWPGNVRELINVLERAVLLCEGALITPDDLPEAITADPSVPSATDGVRSSFAPDAWLDRPLTEGRDALVQAFEASYLRKVLRQTGGNIGDTAARAGIDPRTLYNKMRAYGLRKETFRPGPSAR